MLRRVKTCGSGRTFNVKFQTEFAAKSTRDSKLKRLYRRLHQLQAVDLVNTTAGTQLPKTAGDIFVGSAEDLLAISKNC